MRAGKPGGAPARAGATFIGPGELAGLLPDATARVSLHRETAAAVIDDLSLEQEHTLVQALERADQNQTAPLIC